MRKSVLFHLGLVVLYQGGFLLFLFFLFPSLSGWQFFLTLCVSTLLLIAVLILVQGRFNGQLRAIRKDLKQFSTEGSIDLSKPLESPEGGPATHLITSLNTMTDSLNTIFLDITRSTRKFNLFASDIFFSARHLSEESDSQLHTMEKIMDRVVGFETSLMGLEKEISKILDDLNETAQAYENLQVKSRDAAQTLGPLAESTLKASEDSRQGQEKIDLSSRSVTELVQGLTRLQTGMDHMNQRTSQIGSVIKTLEDIADRTHVLATNASIEAARAGQEGRGFGVIASEIRSLSASSRAAIHDVGEFLEETRREVSESSRLWTEEMARVDQVRLFGEETRRVLDEISRQLYLVSQAMGGFQKLFDQQHGVILGTLDQSREIHRGIQGFSKELQAQSLGYRGIQEDVERAAEQSRTSSRSARVLSQLGTYLRIGGQELKYVVTKFKVSEQRHLGLIARKEQRRALLYNLEVVSEGTVLGHLGDLSPSGLLLYCEGEMETGVPRHGVIQLPLGFDEASDIPIRFTPRRVEKDNTFYRIGCSLEASDTRQHQAIAAVLDKLTIHDYEDLQKDSYPAGGAAPFLPEPEELEEL